MTVTVIPVEGIGEARPGDDVTELLLEGLEASGITLEDGDAAVVTHKLVSKAEGRVVEAGDDPAARLRVIHREAAAVLRRRGELVITETRHGFVCANAGVDRSNSPAGRLVLLPIDPDRSARRIRARLRRATGA